jgi:hypothetical protein
VRLSLLVKLLAVPFLAIFLSSCSKEGNGSPKIQDKAPDLKPLPRPVSPAGDKGNKGAPGPGPVD